MTVLLPPAHQPLGRIVVDSEPGAQVLRLVGEIDAAAVETFEAEQPLPETADEPSTPHAIGVVDLSEVTFLSSSGLACLIRLTQPAREQGHLPTLRGLTNPARRILTMTGATRLFHPAA
jgi:anti-anti-sigma factor